jgi:transcriptional regulator with XRE-family HTH domain
MKPIPIRGAKITGAQIRAARALLHLTQSRLVKLSGVRLNPLRNMEDIEGDLSATHSLALRKKLVEFFESCGVTFWYHDNAYIISYTPLAQPDEAA